MASTISTVDWDTIPEKTIPQFFAGLDVFITGGTGFLGKALIEKLLRSCPDIGNIYVLVRPRRGNSSQVRLEQTLNDMLFETLREQGSEVFGKVVAVPGDVAEPGLGLSPVDRKLLQERVSVVFNAAASVRFTDPLQKAVLTNVRSTRDSLQLATGMKQLKVFLHVSTAYSNADRVVIGEELYPPPGDWRTYIQAAETRDPSSLYVLTKKILGRLPNTYTFTKSLAEHVVNDYRDKLPVVIVRPSVVVGAMKEPMPGWADNMNGPFGLCFGVIKGVIRVIWMDADICPDFIPVDVVTKGIIIAAWRRANETSTSLTRVYNAAVGKVKTFSIRNILDTGYQIIQDSPTQSIYYPFVLSTKSYSLFIICVLFLHVTFGALVDHALRISGKKPILLRIQRSIYTAMTELHVFLFDTWEISNHDFLKLENQIHLSDEPHFCYHWSEFDAVQMMSSSMKYARVHIFKETSTFQENRVLRRRLFVLHCVLCVLGATLTSWLWYTYSLHWLLLSVPVRVTRAVFMV